MNEIHVGEHDLLSYLSPGSLWGAIATCSSSCLVALVLTRLSRTVVQAALIKRGPMARTTMSFLMQPAAPSLGPSC